MSRKGKKNITYTQRLQLETLLNAKKPVKEIAVMLGVSKATIYNEIKKGQYKHKVRQNNFWYGVKEKYVNKYSAQRSQDRYDFLCTAKGRPLKIADDFELVNYIDNKVKNEKISACAVLGQIKYQKMQFKTTITKPTLYRYIRLGLFNNIKIGKRKTRYKKVTYKRAPKGTSIELRPREIKERSSFGHWEMDCVCGCNNACLLVLSERLTRKEIIFKMDNQKSSSVIRCLNVLERRFGKVFNRVFKTITVDNGSEFADYKSMEKSIYNNSKRTQFYYCHPYCSCERGTNERLNREIRRLIPKGSNLSKYSIEDIQAVENWINNYPRQVLGYATSEEKFNEQMKQFA